MGSFSMEYLLVDYIILKYKSLFYRKLIDRLSVWKKKFSLGKIHKVQNHGTIMFYLVKKGSLFVGNIISWVMIKPKDISDNCI